MNTVIVANDQPTQIPESVATHIPHTSFVERHSNLSKRRNGQQTGLTIYSEDCIYPFYLLNNIGSAVSIVELGPLSEIDIKALQEISKIFTSNPTSEDLTIGGGRNFMGIYENHQGIAYLGLRTGSRKPGYNASILMERYTKEQAALHHIDIVPTFNLFLPRGSRVFNIAWYMIEEYVEYARTHRKNIIRRFLELGIEQGAIPKKPDRIRVTSHTNYCRIENFQGNNYLVTRCNSIRLGRTMRSSVRRDRGIIYQTPSPETLLWVTNSSMSNSIGSSFENKEDVTDCTVLWELGLVELFQ